VVARWHECNRFRHSHNRIGRAQEIVRDTRMATKQGERIPKALRKAGLTPEQSGIVAMLTDPDKRPSALMLFDSCVQTARQGDAEMAGGVFSMLGNAMARGIQLPAHLLAECGLALVESMRTEDARNAVAGTFGKNGPKLQANKRRNLDTWMRFSLLRDQGSSYAQAVASIASDLSKSESAIRSIVDPFIKEKNETAELIRRADELIAGSKVPR
jgi:hypothetical protein